LIEDYFREIASLIDGEPCIEGASMAYDKRTPHIGFLRGTLYFSDGSVLHLREYVNVQKTVERYMYVYQYQDREGVLVFRYDNSPHFPDLSTQNGLELFWVSTISFWCSSNAQGALLSSFLVIYPFQPWAVLGKGFPLRLVEIVFCCRTDIKENNPLTALYRFQP
jgi:hypothetical protein